MIKIKIKIKIKFNINKINKLIENAPLILQLNNFQSRTLLIGKLESNNIS